MSVWIHTISRLHPLMFLTPLLVVTSSVSRASCFAGLLALSRSVAVLPRRSDASLLSVQVPVPFAGRPSNQIAV
ncbi:hypothetical protein SERLADRAFT_478535 [Serpula lacrymans var. lacrymans S7.9]|uniref:Secreted protein n=1 Tax=Serpula lacrymans var. lacrymans (strain S7.9) TaxID=578457 RepID=F8P9X6_SERL9|nr:uncharacterized protein SERLADRAFT_478535 [Serpula lacrymans var. lacrymans S7.9]EGO19974.1 hypothetical protein SERLADRAFT_478535 [Serpula lacrymans var. lacrymans S7.9]